MFVNLIILFDLLYACNDLFLTILSIVSYFFYNFTIPVTFDIKIIRVLLHHCMIFFQRKVFVKKTQIFYSTSENPLPWIFFFIKTSNSFCIWFTDKLSFFSIVSFFKKLILSMLNSLLKFTNGIGRHLKKIAFSTSNLLFRFSVISFYLFRKISFVMISQII